MSDWADQHADNLLARTLSALALVAFGLSAVWLGGPWLVAAAAAAVTAMGFEWARMSEPAAPIPAWVIAVIAGVGALMLGSWGRFDWAVGLLAAGAVGTAARRATWPQRGEAAFGLVYVGAPCLAFTWIRGWEGIGLTAALCLFAVIWAADIAAYFGGRFIGGPKLLPSLSPRKTWAGLIAGTIAAALAGAGIGLILDAAIAAWIAVGAGLGLIGLAGDLFESLCKRRFGVKDASGLIPGHGGVMDRLDGLMFAVLATTASLAAAPGSVVWLLGGGA
jgi:phosphatidate cytidylyltransferase